MGIKRYGDTINEEEALSTSTPAVMTKKGEPGKPAQNRRHHQLDPDDETPSPTFPSINGIAFINGTP